MYDLEKVWDNGLRLRLQRRAVYLHRLVFFAGGVFLLVGGFYFFLGAAVPVIAVALGSGVALMAGGGFLVEFYRGRPVSLLFDHERRALFVEERDGTRASVSYDRLRDLRMRRQSRRWIIYLFDRDGSYIDLSVFGSRTKARDVFTQLRNRLPLEAAPPGATDPVAPEAEPAPPRYQRGEAGGGVIFWWRDRLTARGSLYVLGFLLGFALSGYGIGYEFLEDPDVAGIALLCLSVIVVYVLFSIVKALRQVQLIRVDRAGLATGRSSSGNTSAFRPNQTVSREAWTGVYYAFDLQSGLQRYLFPDSESRATLAGLYGDDTAGPGAAWNAARVRMRVPQLSLSGLSAADAIRLRDEIEQHLAPVGQAGSRS